MRWLLSLILVLPLLLHGCESMADGGEADAPGSRIDTAEVFGDEVGPGPADDLAEDPAEDAPPAEVNDASGGEAWETTADDGAEDLPAVGWPAGKYVSAAIVHEMMQRAPRGAFTLLNVSDAAFWSMGHLEGSLVIPWDVLSERRAEVPLDKVLIIYCRRGVRSEVAYELMTTGAAPVQTLVLEGGLEHWIAQGYPVVAHEP